MKRPLRWETSCLPLSIRNALEIGFCQSPCAGRSRSGFLGPGMYNLIYAMYLNCHTYYSLRYGTFSELELLQLARENQVAQLALTDINNTSAALNFVRKAPEYGIRPILGIDFRNGAEPCFVGIAKNNEGYWELNAFLSGHLHGEGEFPKMAPKFKNAYIIYPFEKVLLNDQMTFSEQEYIGVSIADLRRLRFSRLLELRDKLVVLQPVTFRNRRDFNAHRLLRAIDNNVLLSKLSKTEEASEDEKMFPVQNLAAAFSEYSFILENTERLMNSCGIHFDFSKGRKPQNLETYLGSRTEDEALLEKLCQEGLPYRYPEGGDAVVKRMEKEMETDQENGFCLLFFDQLGHCFPRPQKRIFLCGPWERGQQYCGLSIADHRCGPYGTGPLF